MLKRLFYKIDKVMLITAFGLMIYIPLITGVLQEDKTVSNTEKRNLATFPKPPGTLDELSEFPKQFNLYYSDHSGFREKLTRAYFKNINKLGQHSSLDDVTFGRDGWLFLGSTKPGYTGYGDPFGGAMNANLFTQQELERYVEPIIAIDNWLKQQGIAYLFVIAPNKHTIYFDKLPEYVSKINNISAMDQLLNYLQNHTDIAVVDLRPALYEGKKNRQIYYKNGTHWNHYGANIAQFEIMKKIEDMFPGQISATLLTDEQFEIVNRDEDDLAKIAGIETIIEPSPLPIFDETCNADTLSLNAEDDNHYTTTCNTQKLKTVIYRDSFFTALQPYFSRKFLSTTFLWERANQESLLKQLLKDKPDIVISEIVERELHQGRY